MKKILFTLLTLALAVNISAQKSGSKTSLKTENDTISYSYGATLAEQGLRQFLTQSNILGDPSVIEAKYNKDIEAEANPTKKAALEKELAVKLDSAAKADKETLKNLIEGIGVSLKADKKKAAFYRGVAVGSQTSDMVSMFTEQLYGENSNQKLIIDLVLLGISDILKQETPLLDNSRTIVEGKMNIAMKEREAEKTAKLRSEYASEIAAGEEFLAQNRMKDGVVTLPDGLQYKVITQGNGEIPTTSDKVKVHYTGTLIDGTVFDSSVERGSPAVFGVTQVIKGWTEALQLMPVGSKWTVYIPYDLAYGTRETGSIKPFSTLIFDIELLGIEK